MASLIKNQIVKHLSKFVKNLSLDSISVEILRGRGELSNLELDERVLTEVFELPSWCLIKKAVCSRVAIKVPWTKLKGSAIKVVIDEIRVELQLSSELRPNTAPSHLGSTLAAYTETSGYGFADRVVEGMSIYINSLEFYFTSEAFRGSFVLSRLTVESRTPAWQKTDNLRHTRLTDHNLAQVLIFKEIDWQAIRAEACTLAESPSGYTINAPLRLITSHGRSRVALKKNLTDGRVITARIQLILDDILWVATLPQVRSALVFYRYVLSLIQKEAETNKVKKAQEKIKHISTQLNKTSSQYSHSSHSLSASYSSHSGSAGQTPTNGPQSVFQRFDILETSYHFYAGHIDLHICDDGNTSDITFPDDWDIENGAIQLTCSRFACDMYPYHLTASDRSYWVLYKDKKAQDWVNDLLKYYHSQFVASLVSNPKLADKFAQEWAKLTASCIVVRMNDLSIHCVSTPERQGSPRTHVSSGRLLVCSDKQDLCLPEEMPILQLEMSEYYYATGNVQDTAALPLPPRSTFIQACPIKIFVDHRTIRWGNYIYLDMCNRLNLSQSSIESLLHTDIRIEAMMPRIIVPCSQHTDPPFATDGATPRVNSIRRYSICKKPVEMHIHVATAVLSNCSDYHDVNGTPSSGRRLWDFLSELSELGLFRLPHEERLLEGSFLIDSLPFRCPSIERLRPRSSKDRQSIDSNPQQFKVSSATEDIWTIEASPLWIDFVGDPLYFPKPMPFLLDVKLRIWAFSSPGDGGGKSDVKAERSVATSGSSGSSHLLGNPTPASGFNASARTTGSTLSTDSPAPSAPLKSSPANDYVIIRAESGIKVAIDHYQYLSMVQTMEVITDLIDLLDKDMKIFSKDASLRSTCISGLIPWVEFTMILPKEGPLSPYDDPPATLLNDRLDIDVGMDDDRGLDNDNPPSSDGSSLQRNATDPSLGNPTPSPCRRLNGSKSSPRLGGVEEMAAFGDLDSDVASTFGDETASICTDVSDDDANFVVIDSQEVSPFEDIFQNDSVRTEEGVEALDQAMQDKELCSRVLQEQIATVTFKLAKLELLIHSIGQISRTMLQCPFMQSQECTDLTLNDLHVHLAGRTPIPSDHDLASLLASDGASVIAATPSPVAHDRLPLSSRSSSPSAASSVSLPHNNYLVKLQLTKSPDYPNGSLSGDIMGVAMQLTESVMANLTAFLQDDRPEVPVMPLKLRVADTSLAIEDGKSPSPVKIFVDNVWITQSLHADALRSLRAPRTPVSTPDSSVATDTSKLGPPSAPSAPNPSQSSNPPSPDPATVARMRRLEAENKELRKKLDDAKALIISLAKKRSGVDLTSHHHPTGEPNQVNSG